MKKTIEVSEKELKIIKESIEITKDFAKIGVKSNKGELKEKHIDTIYTIEKLEKKLEQ